MTTTNRPTWRARRTPARKNPATNSAQPVSVHWRESQEPPIPLAVFDGELNFDRNFRGYRRYRVSGEVLPRHSTPQDVWRTPVSEPFKIRTHRHTDAVNSPEHQAAGDDEMKALLWFGIDEAAPPSDIYQIDTSSGIDPDVVPVSCQTLGELSYIVKVLRRQIHAVCVERASLLNLVFTFGFVHSEMSSDLVTDTDVLRVFGENIDGAVTTYVPVALHEGEAASVLLGQIQTHIAEGLGRLLSAPEGDVLRAMRRQK